MLESPATEWARSALEKRWRSFAALGERAENLTLEERHDWRKAGKELRYATSFFAPLFPADRVAPMVHAVRRLQNTLGRLNDVAEAENIHRFAPEKRFAAAREALLAHNARRLAAAWPKALRRWGEADGATKYWRPDGDGCGM